MALAQTLALAGVLPFGLLRGVSPAARLRTTAAAPTLPTTISSQVTGKRGREQLARAWHQDEAGRLVCTWHLVSQ
ncbi:hypothetical protein [Methylobacterium sp. JK268]